MTSDSIFAAVTPSDLGLPPKFDRYRLHQRDALDWLHECTAAVNAALLPTGAGKTAIAVSLAKWLGVKAVYLVATKALQAQVMSDFASIGMTDIRGRANYECPNHDDCNTGYDEDCSLSNTSGCAYANALEAAQQSALVITNYAYWLAARRVNGVALEMGRPVELLICDESHAIEQQLTSFASVKIYQRELAYPTIDVDKSGAINEETIKLWTDWCVQVIVRCKNTKAAVERRNSAAAARKDDRWQDADDLEQRANRILKMNPNWVWQFDDRTGHCEFAPVRLGGFVKALFSSVPRVLLMSASLNEFTMRLLMKDEPYDYRAWGQVFNPGGAPVYHIPTRKLNWRSTDEDYEAVIAAVDAVIDNRMDRKGIVHTVSYARSKRALQYSRHASRFFWNETASELSGRLEQFRNALPSSGAILVTPSVEEGFDFPGAECEHQHFIKFPFPNETQKVIAERCKQIPGYRLNYAATKFNQMCGRARRYESDRCENFVYDNSVRQLTGAEGRSYLPPGFRIFTVSSAPPPPPPRI